MTSHHKISQDITSYHITSHHITLHYITSHYITLHHITSHHITLHHITSHSVGTALSIDVGAALDISSITTRVRFYCCPGQQSTSLQWN